MEPRIVIDPYPRTMESVFGIAELDRLSRMGSIIWAQDAPMPHQQAVSEIESADALIFGSWRYGNLPPTKRLKAVIDVSGGLPASIDYEEAHRRNIRVLTASPAFGPSVAEMALGLALASAREIVWCDRQVRSRSEPWLLERNEGMFSLFGQPVGFVGYGAIARHLQQLLGPFRCRISVFDPLVTRGYLESQNVHAAPLEDVMGESRVIFVLAAPTRENKAMLGRSALSLIPSDAVLVLVSRAHLVDFDVLTEHVLAKRYRVAVDVFPDEPLSGEHPIRDADWALLSPHRAGCTPEAIRAVGEMVTDDLEAILAGLRPRRLHSADIQRPPQSWREEDQHIA